MKILALLPLAIILVSGCTSPPPEGNPATSGSDVEITSAGFSPRTLTIQAGQQVNFLNMDSSPHWPASAAHPTHEIYPGSSVTKCGTDQEAGIFDSCRSLSPGESWAFTFWERGSWNYHDHLNPSLIGTIVVQ